MSTSDGSTAANILTAALGHMRDRAATYDKPEGERSMGATVDAFLAVTGDYVMERLLYDPETGDFFYRQRPLSHFSSSRACNAWNARFSGAKTGTTDSRGYLQIKIDGVRHLAHRLAFLYQGVECPELVDHIDRVKTNNSWRNLRPANRSQNAANSNRSKESGIFLRKSGNYSAQICIDYKIKHLGTFKTKREAISVYSDAAKKHFGEYANVFSMEHGK